MMRISWAADAYICLALISACTASRMREREIRIRLPPLGYPGGPDFAAQDAPEPWNAALAVRLLCGTALRIGGWRVVAFGA